jgi:hypothetical protein
MMEEKNRVLFSFDPSIIKKTKSTETEPLHNEVREEDLISAQISKLVRSPGIDFKESIPPA